MAAQSPAGRVAALIGPESPVLSVELVLFGIWGLVAPYLGKAIGFAVDTRPINEVVDHVVPGIVILGVSITAIVMRRRAVWGSVAIVAAGIWMTATHIPLIKQAADGDASMSAALWHSIPGMVVLALGAIATYVDTMALVAEENARLEGEAADGTAPEASDTAGPVAH